MLLNANVLDREIEIDRPIQIVIASNEVEKGLELDEKSSLKTVLAEFTAKGGRIVRLDRGATPFQLAPGDVIFPACSAGKNRSTTLWNILRPYANKITLMPPHATRYGFDPYNNLSNWHRTNHVKINDKDEFVSWAGVPKPQKVGWDVFGEWLSKAEATPDELVMMGDYYNSHYYHPELPSGTRRVYMAFAENAHVHLYRLNQVNESLENVVILFFPLDDFVNHPPSEWETNPYSAKAYAEFANLLTPYLDFSQLEATAVPSITK